MRFFTITAGIIGVGLVLALLWFLNRMGLPGH